MATFFLILSTSQRHALQEQEAQLTQRNFASSDTVETTENAGPIENGRYIICPHVSIISSNTSH